MQSSRSGPDPLDPGSAGFAHRGLHGSKVPENSLAGFEAAIAIGAGIECDVRLSGDRTAVVFHDGDLKRMCDIALNVEQTAAALLTGQRLTDSDQFMPALWKLLDLVDGQVPLLLELKTCNGNAAPLSSEVFADIAPRKGAIGVMSFDPLVARWFLRHAPLVRRGLVIKDGLPALRRWIAMLVARPHFLAVDRSAVGKMWVRRARRRMPVYAWTIRTDAQRAQAKVHADALIWEGDGRPRI